MLELELELACANVNTFLSHFHLLMSRSSPPQVKVLRSISPLKMDDVILGQYQGDPNGEGEAKDGYLDDPTVPKGSITPIFAMAALRINNEQWDGELRERERKEEWREGERER